MELVADVQDASGSRLQRCRIGPEGLTIGRSWDCDIIVRDGRVEPRHLLLRAEGDAILVEDTGSLNGSRLNGQPLTAAGAELISGAHLQIGKASITCYRPDHPVAPARSPSTLEQARETLGSLPWALLITIGCVLASVALAWLGSSQRFEADAVFDVVASNLAFAALWAAVWGLLGKLLRNETHALAHWSVALLFALTALLIRELAQYAGWLTQSQPLAQFVSTLLRAGQFMLFGVLTLSIATGLRARPRWLVAALPALLLIIAVYVPPLLEDDDFTPYPQILGTSRPPAWRLGGGENLDELLQAAPGLFDDAAAAAQQRAERQAERDPASPPASAPPPAPSAPSG